jgi:hypothetical protein
MVQIKLNPNPRNPGREVGSTQSILQRAGIRHESHPEGKELNVLFGFPRRMGKYPPRRLMGL